MPGELSWPKKKDVTVRFWIVSLFLLVGLFFFGSCENNVLFFVVVVPNLGVDLLDCFSSVRICAELLRHAMYLSHAAV